MAESPQVETANTLTIDTHDNPALRDMLGQKEVGEKCRLTFELQVMSRYPEGFTFSIEKIISDHYGADGNKEADASDAEPVMATIKSKNRKTRGMSGPHGMDGGPKSRPPETAMNSAEPWLTSYV